MLSKIQTDRLRATNILQETSSTFIAATLVVTLRKSIDVITTPSILLNRPSRRLMVISALIVE